MSRFVLVSTMIISSLLISTVSAADITTTGSMNTPTSQSTETPLHLDTVTITDATTVALVFNQAIRIDSLRVRIIDQATNESVKVASITGSLEPTTAIVKTTTPLTAGASYVLTITSALSMTDMTIRAGIDSIREFAVPVNLPGTSLNAPSNPNAVIVATGTVNEETQMTPPVPVKKPVTATGVTIPQKTDTLPATGTPTTILIIVAALSALGLLFVRKRA